jgi:hypothetical protein
MFTWVVCRQTNGTHGCQSDEAEFQFKSGLRYSCHTLILSPLLLLWKRKNKREAYDITLLSVCVCPLTFLKFNDVIYVSVSDVYSGHSVGTQINLTGVFRGILQYIQQKLQDYFKPGHGIFLSHPSPFIIITQWLDDI